MPRHLILGVTVLAAVVTAPAQVAVGGEIQLELDDLELPLDGDVVVYSTGDPATAATYPFSETLRVDEVLDGALVTCRGDRLWCPEVRVEDEPVKLPVFAAMVVTAKLAGPGAAGAAETGRVQGVVQGEKGGTGLQFDEELSVEDGRLTFKAPRSTLDLRFAFAGAAPVYRWGIEPPGDGSESTVADLGSLTLQPGGSMSGWVRRRQDDLPVEGARVAALPVASGDEDVPILRGWEVSTEANGFFQVRTLEPGTYRLKLTAEDLLDKVVEPVEIEAGSETLIGTVHLPSPFRVSVQVTPVVDPDDQPWIVVFTPLSPLPGEEPVEVTASENGTAEVASLRQADYSVQVGRSNANSPFNDVFLTERHSITGEGWLALDVPVVEVEGTVTLGGEPVAALVKLATGNADAVVLKSDNEGELTGWIRRPEHPWLLATVTWTEGEEPRERQLELQPAIEDDLVHLDIELPVGTIYGEVVDSEGRLQRNLRVVATPADGASRHTEVRVTTDRNGRFRLTGLETAEYLVQAGGSGRPASEVVRVDLSGDLPISDLRLVVWPVRRLEGQLTIGGQPVAGASVRLYGIGRVPAEVRATTDAQGTFGFDVPEALDRAVVTVNAVSRLLWSGCLPIDGDRLSLALSASPQTSLSLTLTGRNDLPPAVHGRAILLTGDGGFVNYDTLFHWNRQRNAAREIEEAGDGQRGHITLRLPGLAATSYAITWTPAPDWVIAAQACAGGFAQLDWVTLAPGGQAPLLLDVAAIQERALEEPGG